MGIKEKLWYIPYCPESMESGTHHFHRIGMTPRWKCRFCNLDKFYPVSMPDGEAYQTMLHKLGYSTSQALLAGPHWRKVLAEFKKPPGREVDEKGRYK